MIQFLNEKIFLKRLILSKRMRNVLYINYIFLYWEGLSTTDYNLYI
jgi:hypothetical protein